MDVNTARLRAFVAVAEELSFTAAARRLHVAQQALSAGITRLERDLGMRLFERTTREVRLSESGALLLPYIRRALAELDRGIAAAEQNGRTRNGVLRVGAMVGVALELTDSILAEFRREHPDTDVELTHFFYADPSAGLRSGTSDVAFVRPPISRRGLSIVDLVDEPVVAVLPSTHSLAARQTVTLSDLAGETVTRPLSPDEEWNRFWGGNGHFARSEAVRTLEEALEFVAAARGVSLAAAGWVRYAPRRGLTAIPVEDLPRCALAIATRRDPSAVTSEFVAIAARVRDARPDLVRVITAPFGRLQ